MVGSSQSLLAPFGDPFPPPCMGDAVAVMSPVDDGSSTTSSEASRENESIPGMSGITESELLAKYASAGESPQANEEGEGATGLDRC